MCCHDGAVVGSAHQRKEPSRYRHGSARERSRKSSCTFADEVARSCIATYHANRPPGPTDDQTVLAAFVIAREGHPLTVCSFGVGTKFLPSNLTRDPRGTAGERVRDCHAEVLARRGFVNFLYDQLEAALRVGRSGDAGEGSLPVPEQLHFEWEEGSPGTTSAPRRLALRPGRELHFYTSSQPRGNATIKKWATCKAPLWHDLPPDAWPAPSHPPMHVTKGTRAQGHVSLLVKRQACAVDGAAAVDAATPVGTAKVGSGFGSTMTCSDKIARWNALGVQGGLLSHYFAPLLMATCTVGRKFTQIICERALCCRLAAGGMLDIHHLSMLCTAVKLDAGVYDMAAGQGAAFSDRCLVWSAGRQVETLHGPTGLVVPGDGTSFVSRAALCARYGSVLRLDSDAVTRASLTKIADGGSVPYAALKAAVGAAAGYTLRKEMLLGSPLLFGDWCVGPESSLRVPV
eukprot:gene6434-1147_t